MKVRFIQSPEKKKIIGELNEQFGISKIPHLLFEVGKGKIKGYTGSLSKEEISHLGRTVNVELIGLYLMKKENEWRLSLDALHLLKEQITKSIIEINDSHLGLWLRGKDIEFKSEVLGVVVLKHKNDFVGCGKSNGLKVFNYIPRERRIKSKSI